MVGYAAVCLAMTVPGQTVIVSVFVDPMIESLAVSRSQLSTAYLLGTLMGAASLPAVGRWLDRAGIRRVALGTAGGTIQTLEAAAFPRFYGMGHIWAIRGAVMALLVTATAFGPLTLALGHERFGSHVAHLNVLLIAPVAVSVAALFVHAPGREAAAVG